MDLPCFSQPTPPAASDPDEALAPEAGADAAEAGPDDREPSETAPPEREPSATDEQTPPPEEAPPLSSPPAEEDGNAQGPDPSDPFSSENEEPGPYYGDEPPPAEANDAFRRVSVTFSPLHLFTPLLEVTGELRASPRLGVAVIVGAGTVSVEDDYGAEARMSVFEAGGQIVWYPLKDFESLQLGAEVMYVYVTGDVEEVGGYGSGFAVGPLVGYKLITDAGFTLSVQGGLQVAALEAEARSRDAVARDSTIEFSPFLNFNLGWSF